MRESVSVGVAALVIAWLFVMFVVAVPNQRDAYKECLGKYSYEICVKNLQ